MRRTMAKASFITAMNLLAFAMVGTIILALVYEYTKAPIAASETQARLSLISQIVPEPMYDNDIMDQQLLIDPHPLLGTQKQTVAYRAQQNGRPTAVVLQAVAPDGYSGKIKLILAVRVDGTLSGVRVVSHLETPGLGDFIDISKSDWITVFKGLSLSSTDEDDWQVEKDGGRFDHMAGATVTPRAVVKAVHKALQYFETHKQQLLTAPVVEVNEDQEGLR